MSRPTRDVVLMQTAEAWAQRSTCSRLSVGAVASRDGRILVQGYNGAPAGMAHCPDIGQPLFHSVEQCRAVHAELNMIAWAARNGVRLEGCEVHCTDSPCLNCARAMINSGVRRFTFKRLYRLVEGLDLMSAAGVEVIDFSGERW
jgi:dCMP deaminase